MPNPSLPKDGIQIIARISAEVGCIYIMLNHIHDRNGDRNVFPQLW